MKSGIINNRYETNRMTGLFISPPPTVQLPSLVPRIAYMVKMRF